MLGSVGWPEVVLALIAAVPGIIAAVFAGLARQEVKAQDGATLSRRAEQTHALVTRTLGERRGDKVTPSAGHEMYERADDD